MVSYCFRIYITEQEPYKRSSQPEKRNCCHDYGTDDRLYQMSHSAKIEHALAAILAVSVIHSMKREQSRILAVSVARVIWRDSLARENRGHENHRDR
jgi:hypothetical protein